MKLKSFSILIFLMLEACQNSSKKTAGLKNKEPISDRNKKEEANKDHSLTTQGSISQYSEEFKGKGKSACTFIATRATFNLLNSQAKEIDAKLIDTSVREGVESYHESMGASATIHSDFFDTETYYKYSHKQSSQIIAKPISMRQKIKEMNLEFKKSYACVLTKQGESISFSKINSDFYLFDSHPQKHRKLYNAYIKIFKNTEDLLTELSQRFPYMDDAGMMFFNAIEFNCFQSITKKK